jgi:acyl carrier protein
MDTIPKLKVIFESHFKQPVTGFGETTSPVDIEKWDSIAHVGLVLEIERAFEIEFTPSELGKLTDVGAIAKLIELKVGAWSSANGGAAANSARTSAIAG